MNRSTIESFTVGLSAAGTAAVLGVMAGLGTGGWSRPHLVVMPAGVIAAAVTGWFAHRQLHATPFRIGAAAAAILALLPEFATPTSGIGALQFTAMSLAVAVAVVGPGLLRPLTSAYPGGLIWLGLVAVALVFVRIVIGGGELGHDEAAYALKARTWLDGAPDTGWSIHRGVGQSVVAATILPFSQSPVVLRLVSVFLSLATVVAVWGLGRAMGSNRVGIMAAGVFAVSYSFLRRGAEFLTDVPSTGLLVVVALLLWLWIKWSGPGHSHLLWAAAVGAVAVYVRYQAILSLGLLAIAVGVVAWDKVRRSLAVVVGAAGFGLFLLLPHFIYAVVTTGRPWGVFEATRQAGGRRYLGEGLVDYVRDFPDLLAGPLGAVAILVGLGWFGWGLLSGADRQTSLFLMIPALGQIAVLGLVSHGEPRFVFFPVALLAIAAGLACEHLRHRISPATYRTGAVAVAMAMVISLALQGDRADRNAEARGRSIDALVQAARVVETEAGGRCGIVTGMQPQLTWLSGCPTEVFDRSDAEVGFPPGVEAFVVLAERGPRQPDGELRQDYLDLAVDEPIVIESEGSFGDVAVWRVSD